MIDFSQGDLIKIEGTKHPFLIVSSNLFIRYTGTFHICPVVSDAKQGPLHIRFTSSKGTHGIAICEQLLLVNPSNKLCNVCGHVSYDQIMNVSDAIQGIFEYD